MEKHIGVFFVNAFEDIFNKGQFGFCIRYEENIEPMCEVYSANGKRFTSKAEAYAAGLQHLRNICGSIDDPSLIYDVHNV